MISSWINPYCIRDFSRLEVTLQQAGESLAVTGLVAGHLLVTSLPLVTKV